MNDPDRRTGRTTRMLNECIDAVLEGQPKCVVIGASVDQARWLQQMMLDLMHQRKLQDISILRSRAIIQYDGSEIRFISKTQYERFIQGTRGWGEFWDHYAEESITT